MSDLIDRFTTDISKQLIFQTFYEPLLENHLSNVKKRSKLVCRNNSDLFYAKENLVRACTVNTYSSNFRILENDYGSYQIKSLEMNSLGTLLALIGDDDLVVLSLPNSINSITDSIIPAKSYKIKNIGGSIVKVIWQEASTNDCSIVVLNNKSEIKLFDLSISTSIPQCNMSLKENMHFDKEDATSITFGSLDNLQGALTLYIASSKGKIYSVFPFVHKNANLSIKKSSLTKFIKESEYLIRSVEKQNPEEDSFNLRSSVLRKALVKQYEYFSHLSKQLNSNVKPRVEKRNTLSDTPLELYIVGQNLPDTFKPCLQGPMCSVENSIEDITNFVASEDVSIISTLSLNNSAEPVLSYFAQLKPLIMKWTECDEEEDELEKELEISKTEKLPLITTNINLGYRKPAKGFGFIDMDDEPDVKHELSNSKLPNSAFADDLDYWNKNFKSLSILSAEVIPVITKSEEIYFDELNRDDSKLCIVLGGKVIICDASKWVNDIIGTINRGELSDTLIESSFKSVSDGENINSIVYIKDKVYNTGEYMIILRYKKESNLDIIQISNNFSSISNTDLEDASCEYYQAYQPILTKEPFEELDHELLPIKDFKAANILYGLKMTEINNAKVVGPELLTNLNLLSINTIGHVSKFTKFILHLNFRVLTQVDELKDQIQTVNKLHGDKMKAEKLAEIDEKINNLIEKQEKIDLKTKKIKEKLIESIQRITYSRTLPLSKTEKDWFKEINAVNSELSQDTKEKDSLIKVMKNLESQVQLLIKDPKLLNKPEDASLDEKLTQHQLHQNLTKLKSWLIQEGSLIDATKSQLEESFKKLQV